MSFPWLLRVITIIVFLIINLLTLTIILLLCVYLNDRTVHTILTYNLPNVLDSQASV